MFKFRLQRVLELREKREEARAIELAKAEETAGLARTQRDELQAMHSASRAQIASAHVSDPTVGHLHHLGFVLGALDVRLSQAAQVVTKAEDIVSEARVSLEQAARDRRVLGRLKDKHTDVFRWEEAQRDRIAMDEIALTRFARIREANQRDDSTESDASQKPDGASRA